MSHLHKDSLTLFSGPVIERDGTEHIYVGAYIPETVTGPEVIKVQQCIGFLAVPNYDPTTYPQPRDGWIVRPARETDATIEDVFTKVFEPSAYEHLHTAIARPVLETLVGKDAIVPPPQAS